MTRAQMSNAHARPNFSPQALWTGPLVPTGLASPDSHHAKPSLCSSVGR